MGLGIKEAAVWQGRAVMCTLWSPGWTARSLCGQAYCCCMAPTQLVGPRAVGAKCNFGNEAASYDRDFDDGNSSPILGSLLGSRGHTDTVRTLV